MDDTIHQLTVKFLKTLSANLGKTTSKSNPGGGNEVLSDPTLQIIIHMISCTKSLRDAFEISTGGSAAVSTSGGMGSVKKPKSSIHFQLYQPLLNGILVLLGKMLMDSFTYEPKVTETAAFSAAYGILGRHVLTQFPEMATKKHKTSGKMLIHHAVFKARPAIAEETVGFILKVSPASARAEDATGALPLHWATRNPDVSFEMIDLLLKAYPDAPTKTDNKGFLPLHWAVNQDAPNIEVVRKLIKIFPAGAGMPSLSGNLPLHYCVSRARPSIPVIKALITAFPEAIRFGCEEGFLPLHRYLYRPIVDLDALRLLINYFPDALMAKSTRGQTPLHVALDHHSPDALAVGLLLEMCPAAVSVADSDRYLPLHLCLDCAEPNYSLATQLLMQHPQAASAATKDEMLPLHLVVGANSDPTHEHANHGSAEEPNDAIDFVNALLNANPAALVTSVRDIIPAMDGEALADPESWSGEWIETQWSPLTRARDRGLNGLVKVFRYFQVRHGIADPSEGAQSARVGGGGGAAASAGGSVKGAVVTVQPGSTRVTPTTRAPVADVHFDENNTSMENINFNAAKPVKSQPLHNINNPNNYSGMNPIRTANPDRVRGMASVSGDDNNDAGYYAANNATSEDAGAYDGNIVNRASRLAKPTSAGAPVVKVPPHILKAQQMARGSSNGSQSGESRASSRERGGTAQAQFQQRPGGMYPDGSLMVESVGELPSYLNAPGGSRDATPLRQGIIPSSSGANSNNNFNSGYNPNASTGSARSQGSNNKAPPPGPIPASLLQAAENNAQRYGRAAAAAVSSGPPVMTAAQLQQINDAAKATKRSTNTTVPASPQNANQRPKQSRSPKGSFNFNIPEGNGSSKTGLAATTGRAAPSSTRNSGSRNNNNNAGEGDADDERVGTAPELGLGKKNRPDPKIVGFGSQSAWSNGEETAEDSAAGQNPGQNRAAPPSVAPAALNAKQQRLLQAQQQYMKRAAGNNAGVPVDAVSSGIISVKPVPSPSMGIHTKAAPTNHTSEIIKNMGGKVRIHPLAGSAQNVKTALNSTGNTNVDEMV